ncbi:MAG: polyprenyl synthetase family protein [Lachnospiraceae bacterium]
MFLQTMQEKTNQIEQIMEKYLPIEEGFQKTVIEANNYSIKAGGKRLRPLLMQEAYRLFGGNGKEIEPFMVAMEMIHTFSLVHDDLPCMDNDQYRRGKLTTWYKFGYDMGVLSGDGLVLYAFESAAKAFNMTEHLDRVGRAMQILANKAGIYGMLGGQAVDVEMTGKPMTMEQIDFVYRLKTGALIEASLMIGAVLAGAKEEEIADMEKIGRNVGVAFQIQDDILDLTSTTEILGKPVLSDEKNQKNTYVTLVGIEQAKLDVAAISQQAIDLVGKYAGEDHFLEQLIRMLITREK